MTVEQVLRRIEAQCRLDMEALEDYHPQWRRGSGRTMKGARSEAWGYMDCCKDIRALCRKLRKCHKQDSIKQLEGA